MWVSVGTEFRRISRLWAVAITGAALILGLLGHGPRYALANAAEPPSGFLAYEVHGARLLIKTETGGDRGSIFAVMRAGTGDQAPDETHCAHIAEHTVFRNPLGGGTRSLADTVVAWQGLYNGWTGPDHTQFELSVPHRNIPDALRVLIRALFPAGIDESAFRQELEGRLKSELEYMTTNERAAPFNALRLRLLANTAYGEQLFAVPVTGVPRERVLSYMRREYSPQRLLLVVVANVDAFAVMEVAGRELELIPQGKVPKARLTRLDPLPVQELTLPKVDRPLVLVGLGVGGVTDEDFPYLLLAYALLMEKLPDGVPLGLKLDPQLCGPLPVQGAACLMVGYEAAAAPGAKAGELAPAAIHHVGDRLARLRSEMTDREVTKLLESMAGPEQPPELPQNIPASLYEAYRVGIATVPGTAMGLGAFFKGATALEVKQRMVDVLDRYAASATFTAVVSRGAQKAPGIWLGALIAVPAVAGVLIWRRRHSVHKRNQK